MTESCDFCGSDCPFCQSDLKALETRVAELKSALAGLLSYTQQLELLVYPDDGSAHHPAITAAWALLRGKDGAE